MDSSFRIKEKAERARLELLPPASEEEVRAFEATAGVELPADFRAFVAQVANGGTSSCRLLPLERWDASYWIDNANLATDLRRACLITPECGDQGSNWLETLGVTDGERKLDDGLWSPMFGTIAVAEIGCGLYFSMIVNGPYRGRVFTWGDAQFVPPEFVPFQNFGDWIEHWLDQVLAGKAVHFLNPKSALPAQRNPLAAAIGMLLGRRR